MRIVYRNLDDAVGILSPIDSVVEQYGLTVLAAKDVPEGLPFWIVEDSEIPTDRTFRDAWEIPEEWGEPDGYGSEFSTFKEVLNALNQ